jgi:hypothetical protein
VQKLRRLVAGFPSRRPGFKPGSDHMGFVVDKAAVGQVFYDYFCFTYQSSHRIHHPGPVQSGRRTKLTQSDPLQEIKRRKLYSLYKSFVRYVCISLANTFEIYSHSGDGISVAGLLVCYVLVNTNMTHRVYRSLFQSVFSLSPLSTLIAPQGRTGGG